MKQLVFVDELDHLERRLNDSKNGFYGDHNAKLIAFDLVKDPDFLTALEIILMHDFPIIVDDPKRGNLFREAVRWRNYDAVELLIENGIVPSSEVRQEIIQVNGVQNLRGF